MVGKLLHRISRPAKQRWATQRLTIERYCPNMPHYLVLVRN